LKYMGGSNRSTSSAQIEVHYAFAPLLLSIEPKMKELTEIFSGMYRSEFPKTSHGYIDYHTYMDLWDFGVFSLMFAAVDGKLYLPETPEKGVPLTLVIIK